MFRARLPLYQVLCLGLCAALGPAGMWAGQAQPDKIVLTEGFEGEIPDFHTYQATYAADETRARTGKRSLRVTPAGTSGGAYFKLQGLIDPSRDYEFSSVGPRGSARREPLHLGQRWHNPSRRAEPGEKRSRATG